MIKFQEVHNTKALFLSNIKGVLNGRENITERPQLIAQAMKIKELQCLDNTVYNPKLKKRNSIKHTKESLPITCANMKLESISINYQYIAIEWAEMKNKN